MSTQDQVCADIEAAIAQGLDRDYFPAAPAIAKSAMRAAGPLIAAALDAARAEGRERIAELEAQLDACQLRYIEATNPGIDMDEVRRLRASGYR